MITATDLEVRAGARTLLSADGPALRIQPGDRIGLVGRNGAGKTTTMRILAGEGEPYAGAVTRTGASGGSSTPTDASGVGVRSVIETPPRCGRPGGRCCAPRTR